MSQEAASTQDRSESSEHRTLEGPMSQENEAAAHFDSGPQGKLASGDVSTLRQALLGTAAAGGNFAQFRCRREKAIGPTERSGVYCVQEDNKGRKQIGEVSKLIIQGNNLTTTVEQMGPTGRDSR